MPIKEPLKHYLPHFFIAPVKDFSSPLKTIKYPLKHYLIIIFVV